MYKNAKANLYFQNSQLSLLVAFITLPIMTKPVSELSENISKGEIALDISYYQRIFSINNSYILGNFYVDKVDFRERVVDFYNVGELLQRLGFKFFESNIIFTYLFFSLFYLFLWINLLSWIISYENSKDIHKSVIVSLVVIVFFFSNFLIGILFIIFISFFVNICTQFLNFSGYIFINTLLTYFKK
jgi:hypothetical protein